MIILRCVLLILIALSTPKLWQAANQVSERQFSKVLLSQAQPSMSEPVQQILMQPFAYWGKGSQFFVFLSRDRRYVLKIPRSSKMNESLLDRITHKTSKKPDVLESLAIAMSSLVSQTAILYVHYGITDSLPCAAIADGMHRRRLVDLNRIPFALQEKKGLMSRALKESGNQDESRRILTSFLDLIASEKASGWMSQDCQFWLNFGYHDGQAWRIDVGSYVPLSPHFSWRRAAKPISRWLQKNDPQLGIWFERELLIREERE